MIKIWHISDTHAHHDSLTVPNVDMVIFSGDCSNPREPSLNEHEVRNFITWFSNLHIKHKIFIPGNHDTSIEQGYITKDNFGFNINYLCNDFVTIKGLKIWGSPYTPSFGIGWAFNKARDKIHEIWDTIPDDTDIIVTHGPPRGILDLSYNRNNELEFCGCTSLYKRIRKINPKLVCFGHIHNSEDVKTNQGYMKLADKQTIYSNGSVVEDGRFRRISSEGNIFEL